LHGFSKNEKDNISKKEKEALDKIGAVYIRYTDAELSKLVREGLIIEVKCYEQNS
jgi:hypothetical protein